MRSVKRSGDAGRSMFEGDRVGTTGKEGQGSPPRQSVVAETAGAATVSGPPLTAEEEREAIEVAIAEDVFRRMAD
jgi:hypothetical protein